MPDRPERILVVDFWSDNNRGDAAMQVGLLEHVRRQAPRAHITVMTAFGANQWPQLLDEFDESQQRADEIVPGFRSTFASLGSSIPHARLRRKTANFVALPAGIAALPLWFLTVKSKIIRRFVPGRYRRAAAAVAEADLVIWNGRNFRCDSRRREPYELWQLLYNPLVSIVAGKPVACLGASIWPLHTRSGRWLLRSVLGRARFCSLREAASMREAKRILGGSRVDLSLLPDMSLAVLPVVDTTRPRLAASPADPLLPRRVGVTIVDWPGAGDSARSGYVEAMVGAVEMLLESGCEVRVIEQVSYHDESTGRITDMLRARFGSGVEYRRDAATVQTLTDEYADVDLLVATRMHSAIFALTCGTPVVTIPYDAGGKWAILDMMGAHDVDVPFIGVTAPAIIEKVRTVWARRNTIVGAVRAEAPRLKRNTAEHVARALSYATRSESGSTWALH